MFYEMAHCADTFSMALQGPVNDDFNQLRKVTLVAFKGWGAWYTSDEYIDSNKKGHLIQTRFLKQDSFMQFVNEGNRSSFSKG